LGGHFLKINFARLVLDVGAVRKYAAGAIQIGLEVKEGAGLVTSVVQKIVAVIAEQAVVSLSADEAVGLAIFAEGTGKVVDWAFSVTFHLN
jgi:hypothetical protein